MCAIDRRIVEACEFGQRRKHQEDERGLKQSWEPGRHAAVRRVGGNQEK